MKSCLTVSLAGSSYSSSAMGKYEIERWIYGWMARQTLGRLAIGLNEMVKRWRGEFENECGSWRGAIGEFCWTGVRCSLIRRWVVQWSHLWCGRSSVCVWWGILNQWCVFQTCRWLLKKGLASGQHHTHSKGVCVVSFCNPFFSFALNRFTNNYR